MLRSAMIKILVSVAAAVVLLVGAARAAVAGPPQWSPVSGALSVARLGVNVVVLHDGRALVIGGQAQGGAPSPAVDIYDPATRSLTAGAPLAVGRVFPATAVLADGRVLVAGGVSANDAEASAEIYDPVNGTWSAAAPMPAARSFARAVTLNDGRVLVVGGDDSAGNALSSTLLFTPDDTGGSWAAGPALATARVLPDVTILQDGSVLVSGGGNPYMTSGVASAERLDAAATAFAPAGQMSAGRALAVTVRLADGRVLSAGGSPADGLANGGLASADIYDPSTNQWTAAAPMAQPRFWANGGVLPDGTVLVAAGATVSNAGPEPLNTAERYDPVSNTWAPAPSMATARYAAGSVVVGGGLLIAGGTDANAASLSSAELFAMNRPPIAQASAPATVVGASGVLAAVPVSAAGSTDPDGDPLTYTWSEGSSVLAESAVPSATVGLPVGPHTLTLTVDDGFGGTATATAAVTVTDGTAALQQQMTQLTAQLQQAQQQLAAAEQVAANAVSVIQSSLRAAERDPLFTVPGATPDAQLQAIVQAVVHLKRHCLEDLYEALRPPREHGPHGSHGPGGHDGRGGHEGQRR